MRFFSFTLILAVAILEVGPIPITPIFLMWIVLFRPVWFYEWVQKIYNKKKASDNMKNSFSAPAS